MNAPQIQARPIPDLYRRFQPWMIPGLGFDLDASFGVLNSIGPDVPAANGQAVRRWLDKSGNGRHFDQATAILQPIFLSNGLNGGPAVDFDGLNDYVQNAITLARPYTLFFVAKWDEIKTSRLAISPATNERVTGATTSGGTLFAGGSSLVQTPLNYSPAIIRVYLSDALGEIQISGGATTSGSVGTGSINGLALGGDPSSGTAGWNGKVARVLVWPRALTASELLQVHRYLSATYGIPLA